MKKIALNQSKKLLFGAVLSIVTMGVALADHDKCRNNGKDPLVGVWAGTIGVVGGLFIAESAVVNADGTLNFTGADNTGTTPLGFTSAHVGQWKAIGRGKYEVVVTAIQGTANVRELSKGTITLSPDCQTYTGVLVSNFYVIPTTPPFTAPPFSELSSFFPNTPVSFNFYRVKFSTK